MTQKIEDIPQIYQVKQKSLFHIMELLNLPHKRSNQDNVKQIIKELQENCDYVGEYDTRYILEFLDIYFMTYNNKYDEYIRSITLEYIMNDDNKYYINENIYNRIITPEFIDAVKQIAENMVQQERIDEYIESLDVNEHDIFNANINTLNELNSELGLEQCNNVQTAWNQIITKLITHYHYFGEYNIDYIYEFIILYSTAMFEGEEGIQAQIKLNSLVTNDDLIDIDIEGDKHYMDKQSYQILHDEHYLKDVDKLTSEEIEKQNEYQNYVNQNDEQNNFLTNKDMTEPPRTRQIRQLPEYTRQHSSKSKYGMNELAHLVLDMQRDFKRVTKALSAQGAQEIIDKHNVKSPNSQWKLRHEDVNRDGIPDILILNDKDKPIVVNGWTTKGSNYPEQYQYYKKYPTRDDRKDHPFSTFKRDELYQYQFDDNNPNPHLLGNVKSYNKLAYPDTWKLGRYSVQHKPMTRLSAYKRFQRYILQPRLNYTIEQFITNGIIRLNGNGSFDNKLQILSKLTSYLWNTWILKTIAVKYGKNIDDKDFVKYKTKKEGKQEIDTTVSALYLHLNETNGTAWTPQQRQELENRFMHDLDDKLEQLVRNTNNLTEHHYYDMTGTYNEHNPETEGAFDEFEE